MPCYDPPEVGEYYESLQNEKKYGLARSNKDFMQEIACEMAKVLEAEQILSQLSKPAQKWVAEHKLKDAEAGRPWE